MTETGTIFTSTLATGTGVDSLSLAEEIKKYDTEELINFLRKEVDLKFDDDDGKIIRKERITGHTFLMTTEETFRSYGMKGGPALKLADFAKECKEKKLRAFPPYLSLDEVIKKYDLGSNGMNSIPLFTPSTHEIQGNNKVFERCIKEVLGRLRTYGTLQ